MCLPDVRKSNVGNIPSLMILLFSRCCDEVLLSSQMQRNAKQEHDVDNDSHQHLHFDFCSGSFFVFASFDVGDSLRTDSHLSQ
jgi:hypothetical protein